MRLLKVLGLCAALMIAGENLAYAYTDPGSGTMLLQMLIAFLLGLMFYLRRIIARARGLFGGKASDPAAEAEGAEREQPSSEFLED